MNIKAFLLENIGIRQTILKNTFWLTVAEVVTGLLRLFLLIYVAKILGANEYGKFTFAFSFVSIMVIFSDLGIIDIVTREFSRNREKEKEFPAILTLNIILTLGTLLLMIFGSFFITSDQYIQRLIWILSLFILSTSFFGIFFSFLRSRQKMEYEAAMKIVHTIILVGLSFFSIFYFPSAIHLGYSYLLTNVIFLVIILLFFHVFFQNIRMGWDKNTFKILKISWPLSFGYIPIWIYVALSSVILGYFNLITENGWYGAASKIALIAMIPADLIIRSFYPVLSKFFVNSKENLQKSWNYLMGSMIFLTMPIMVGGIYLAPKIIHFFYGVDFNPSVFSFQLLMVVVAVNFIHYPYSVILIVSDHQRGNFFLIITGILVNIVLNILLIPLYGLYGAIISVIISSAVALLLTMIICKSFIKISLFDIKLLGYIIVASFFSFIMLFVLHLPFIYNLNIFYSVTIGVLTYFIPLFLFYKICKNSTLFTKFF